MSRFITSKFTCIEILNAVLVLPSKNSTEQIRGKKYEQRIVEINAGNRVLHTRFVFGLK